MKQRHIVFLCSSIIELFNAPSLVHNSKYFGGADDFDKDQKMVGMNSR